MGRESIEEVESILAHSRELDQDVALETLRQARDTLRNQTDQHRSTNVTDPPDSSPVDSDEITDQHERTLEEMLTQRIRQIERRGEYGDKRGKSSDANDDRTGESSVTDTEDGSRTDTTTTDRHLGAAMNPEDDDAP